MQNKDAADMARGTSGARDSATVRRHGDARHARAGEARRAMDPAWASPIDGADGARELDLFIFNTDVHLHAYAPDGADAREASVRAQLDEALLACRERCRYFERHLSRTRPDSDIARAHAAAPAPVDVAPETAEILQLARGYCERSGGCFDITMGTVTSLWDFHRGVVPSRLALAGACEHVGMDRFIVDGRSTGSSTLAITDPKTILDVGGIAKGYIADDLGRLLEQHGVHRFALNLGGNVLVRGGRPADADARPPVRAGEPWRIGIVNPLDASHMRAIVDMTDGSVVTSGLHERRFTRGGISYHHILSPRDGMPVRTDVTSATIVAQRSLDCDGYSTTALMLGASAAIEMIEGLDGIEAVIIDERDEVRWTSGLEDRLSLVPTLPRW